MISAKRTARVPAADDIYRRGKALRTDAEALRRRAQELCAYVRVLLAQARQHNNNVPHHDREAAPAEDTLAPAGRGPGPQFPKDV